MLYNLPPIASDRAGDWRCVTTLAPITEPFCGGWSTWNDDITLVAVDRYSRNASPSRADEMASRVNRVVGGCRAWCVACGFRVWHAASRRVFGRGDRMWLPGAGDVAFDHLATVSLGDYF